MADRDVQRQAWELSICPPVNIVETRQQLLAKYLLFMPKSFRDIDPKTLDATRRSFREAAMNLLIHQDYGDHSRKAVIHFFSDGIRSDVAAR